MKNSTICRLAACPFQIDDSAWCGACYVDPNKKVTHYSGIYSSQEITVHEQWIEDNKGMEPEPK